MPMSKPSNHLEFLIRQLEYDFLLLKSEIDKFSPKPAPHEGRGYSGIEFRNSGFQHALYNCISDVRNIWRSVRDEILKNILGPQFHPRSTKRNMDRLKTIDPTAHADLERLYHEHIKPVQTVRNMVIYDTLPAYTVVISAGVDDPTHQTYDGSQLHLEIGFQSTGRIDIFSKMHEAMEGIAEIHNEHTRKNLSFPDIRPPF